MRKTRGGERLLAALLCASLVFQSLSLDAFASEQETYFTEENIETEETAEEEQQEKIPEESLQEDTTKEADEPEISTEEDSQILVSEQESTVEDKNDETDVIKETTEPESETDVEEDIDIIEKHEEILAQYENQISLLDNELIEVQDIDTDDFESKYGLTYEDLLFRCPEYLENKDIEDDLNLKFEYAGEIWGEASVKEDTAEIMYNIKKGAAYSIKKLLGNADIGNTEYENFQIDMAKSVVKDYLNTDTASSSFYSGLAEDFEVVDKVYNVMDDEQIDEYASAMEEACSFLSKDTIEDMVEAIKSSKSFLKYAGDASEAFKLCSSIVAMQELEIEAVELLIECQEPYKKDNELYTALCLLRDQLEKDPAAYVLKNYCVDKILSALVDTLEDCTAAALFGAGGAAVVAVMHKLGKVVVWFYELDNPSYEEIKYCTICFMFYKSATSVEKKYRNKFKTQKTAKLRDEILYEAACQVRYSCLRVFLLNAKSCTSDKSKKRKLQTYYDSIADIDLYSKYINLCMQNASNALKNGTLELSDVVVRKTDKGQTIDESYDSTESIKAKYAEIQKKYPPDVSQTWTKSYGGTSQCFGFARMVFNLLFGCDMPSAYNLRENKGYEYTTDTNVTVIGQLVGSNVTADNMKKLVTQGKLGDITQGYGTPYGQHTMILQEVKDIGATFYQCNYMNDDCLIYTQFYTWAQLANRYGTGDSTSDNGFTLYRASNYATVYGDGSDMFYDDSVNFVINDDGVLTKYNGWQSHVEIPDIVTAIGDSAFKNNTTMMTISIPDSVTKIGDSAFYGCTGLVAVIIPDSVETIGYSAFYNCTSLASVQLSNGVTSIGYWAFRNCTKIKQIEIPKSLTTTTLDTGIYTYAYNSGIFYDCTQLKTIKFEEGTTKIVQCLFANCSGLEEIEIPDTVTSVERYAFYNCSNLLNIKISDTVTDIKQSAFEKCSSIVNLDIPNSVTQIGDSAFAYCTSLKNLKISNCIDSIGYWAFRECNSLEEVEIPKSLTTTTLDTGLYNYAYNSGIFYDCAQLKTVKFEEGTTKIVQCLFANCSGLQEIEIPDTVTSVERYAFYNCSNLLNIKISDTVTNIKQSAFEKCSSIVNLDIPNSVTQIGDSAFAYCTSLKDLKISNRINSIGYWAFRECNSLEEVEIPKSLTTTTLDTGLYTYAYNSGIFYGCTGLKTVKFEEGTTKIAQCLFTNCTGLEEIEIPDTVTIIERYAFYNCSNLKKVTMHDGTLTTINEYAFYKCTNLENIELPNSITGMETYVFSGCTNLKSAKLPNTRVNVMEGTFQNCTSLTSIEFPSTVTTICQYAFQNSGLTELSLPENVTTIENYAFDGCTSLSKVSLNDKLQKIGEYAFRNNDALTEITIPNSVTSIGTYAFQDSDALTTANISDSVTTIGTYIFAHCDSLKNISLGTGLTKIPSYAFNLCPALEKIVIPYRVTTVEANAFTNCTKLTEVTIPRNTSTISTSAFSYPDKLTIYGISGTYAETYAKTIGAKFVNKEVNVTDVTLSPTELSIINGAKYTLTMNVTPSDFTDEVVWKSSDTSIVTVDDTGVVTAKAIGSATVRVAAGEKTASCAVTVVQPVTSISMNKSSLSLDAFEEYTLTATVLPSNAADKSVEWTSSDETVATVTQDGKLTPISKGTATIKATAKDGSGKCGSCTVTVVSEGQICTNYSGLESEHNYANNTNKIWKYTYAGAKTLDITFDSQTKVDDGFDFIYIYDNANKEIKKATGTELAGKTVSITGDTVKIKLVSDEAITAWGFKVTKLSVDGSNEETSEPDETEKSDEKESSTEESSDERPTDEESSDEKQSSDDESDVNIKDGLYISGLKSMTYTGNAIKQNLKLYYNKNLLTESVDYTLSYKNNINVGTASVTIKAKGNLTGTVTKHFEIKAREITDSDVIIDDTVYTYDKKVHKKAPTVTFNGKALKEGKDYEVTDFGSGDYTSTGTYTVTLKGIGNFSGNYDNAKVIIADKGKDISKATVAKIAQQQYQNGKSVELPDDLIKVTLNKTELKNGNDYTVSYSNNINPSKATLIIKGKGDYVGTKKVNFVIKQTPIKLDKSMVTNLVAISEVEAVKGGATPQPVLKANGVTLVKGTDYTIAYKNNKKVGNASIVIKGKGNYSGSVTIPFTITTKDITSSDLDIRVPDVPYTGKANKYQSKPVITDIDGNKLALNKDYKVENYSIQGSVLDKKSIPENGSEITVTIQGKGNYRGTIALKYEIRGINFASAAIKVNSKSYTGMAVTIDEKDIISATIKNGKTATELTYGKDYDIAGYTNNVKKGTATVIFRGKGDYAGEKAVKFKINTNVITE